MIAEFYLGSEFGTRAIVNVFRLGKGDLDGGQRLGARVMRSKVILGHTSTTCTEGECRVGVGFSFGFGCLSER